MAFLWTAGAVLVVLASLASRQLALSTWLLLSPVVLVLGALGWVALDLWLTLWTERRELERTGGRRPRVLAPPLAFASASSWAALQTRESWEAARPSTSDSPLDESLSHLYSLILRDFVWTWYTGISDSPTFPDAVEATLRETVESVAKRVANVDWSDVIVRRLIPIVTRHVDIFRAAERGPDLHTQQSDEFDLLLAGRYARETPTGKLHAAVDVTSLNSKPAEEAHLSSQVDRFLPLIMPEREAGSGAVHVIAREILACTVLLPVVDMLSDPDFWNRLIEQKAGAAIRDQQMVTQFREALDKQGAALLAPSPSPAKRARTHRRTEEVISSRTNAKQFDKFVSGIAKCNSLLDARRLRSDVSGQIRKTRAMLADLERGKEVENGQCESDLLEWVERLGVAKMRADKRIVELGGLEGTNRFSVTAESPLHASHARRIALRDILLHPSSLSYFTEFQDRRNRAHYVQFWLLIEGIKDPLGGVDSDAEGEELLPLPSPMTVATTRSDFRLVWESYFASDALQSNPRYIQTVKAFVEDERTSVTAHELRRVRRAVFAAQQDVLEEMKEDDFPAFARSDLYFKALAEMPSLDAPSEPPRSRWTTESDTTIREPPLQPLAFSPPTSPPLVSSSFNFSFASHRRTETAPPQVTLSGSPSYAPAALGDHFRTSTRAASIVSTDGPGPRRQPLSGSLDFLMTSTGESGSRSPLFFNPLFSDEESGEEDEAARVSDDDYVQVQTIDAVHEALSTVLAANDKNSSARAAPKTPDLTARSFSADTTVRPAARSPVSRTPNLQSKAMLDERRRPSLPEPKRRGLGVFGDEEFDEDVIDPAEPDFDLNTIHRAAPGDLQLPLEIARLEEKISKLAGQETVVGSLIRKAELTGTISELKLLVKSRDSLRREIRALTFQTAQYQSQESENKLLPGRTSVVISGTTIGHSDAGGGQNFQLYLVELHQLATDGTFGSGWIVTRRYSEFATLHASLKEKYVAARQLDLPGKKLVTSYNDTFIESRRVGLEKYLQALIRVPAICQSAELRSFLSQQNISLPQLDFGAVKKPTGLFSGQSLVRSLFRSVTSGIDDMFSGSATSSLMDTIIQRLSQQAVESGKGGAGVQDEDLVSQILAGSTGNLAVGVEEGLSYFTGPIADLFVTLFELNEKNNWLRQAILILLQQVLHGTLERKFRDAIRLILGRDQLVSYVQLLKDGLWSDHGHLKPAEPARTSAQRSSTRDSANKKLSALMPDIAANLIGRANARQGARRLFAVLQNRRLNKHLLYRILDELISVVFPELDRLPPLA